MWHFDRAGTLTLSRSSIAAPIRFHVPLAS